MNELDSQRALHNLKAWVQHNPKYAGLEITNDEYSDGTLMDEVGVGIIASRHGSEPSVLLPASGKPDSQLPGSSIPERRPGRSCASWQVNQLMLQAQRWDPGDADVQVVLGVLYNVSRNYDSAAEAFRRALEARPHDHTLWNKVRRLESGGMGGLSYNGLPGMRRALRTGRVDVSFLHDLRGFH